jgi:hypothetical protein
LDLPRRSSEGTPTSKAAKQVKSRKAVAKDGEWLVAKGVKRKRKSAAKKKPIVAKKANTAVQPKTKAAPKRAASKVAKQTVAHTVVARKPLEVIELSSDDDDNLDRKPSGPAMNIQVRNFESDSEFEFE